MFTSNELRSGDKALLFKHLEASRSTVRGWWPTPGVSVKGRPYAQALWWVWIVARELAKTAEELRSVCSDQDALLQEAARLRALIAADRCLLDFWVVRARKLATVLKLDHSLPDDVLQGLSTVEALLAAQLGTVGTGHSEAYINASPGAAVTGRARDLGKVRPKRSASA